MMGAMWIWPVLVVAGLLTIGYVAVRLVQNRQGPDPTGVSATSPRRILDERYARGEVDDDEYRRRRDSLS